MSGYRFDRLKVLVVDDNAHMRKLVITILQAFGVADTALGALLRACGSLSYLLLTPLSPPIRRA